MESSGLGRPPFTHWSQASRPSCILTCGKDPNSLNPSIPNAGDVKDRKGNLGFALRAPGVVSEAGKYFVAGVHYLHHFNAEMTHVLRKLLGLPHDGLRPRAILLATEVTRSKFPTAALATLELNGTSRELAPGAPSWFRS